MSTRFQLIAATLLATAVALQVGPPLLGSMARLLLQAPLGLEFILSDNPVSLYRAGADTLSGAGFGLPDIEVRTPLTRHHALVQTHVRLERPVPFLDCTEPNVIHINHAVWAGADNYVFASSEAVLRRVAALFDNESSRRRPGGEVEVSGANL
jgi:Protein of unknown function (DUF4238)